MTDHRQRLGEQPIARLLFNLSVPAIVGMASMALYMLADAIFIGRGVGPQGIAGITVVFPLLSLILGLGQLLGIGGASLISRALGAGRIADAERCLGNLVVMVVATSLLVTLPTLLFRKPILTFFGAGPEILPFARDYMTIVIAGSVFQTFNITMNNVIRAQGHAKTAMGSMLLGATLNLVLDPIFIFGLGLGMRGAAWATVAGNLGMSAYVVYYFVFSGRSFVRFRHRSFWLSWPTVCETISVGFPSFVRQSSSSLMIVLANRMLTLHGGDEALAMFGILHRLLMFFLMPIFGIIHGLLPIVGFNYGAGNYARARQAVHLAINSTTILTSLAFLIFMTIPGYLTFMFTNDPNLLAMAPVVLRICVLGVPTVGFQFVTSGMYQALGRARPALVLSLARQVLFLIPLLLLLPHWLGVHGVWLAIPLADGAAAILTWFMYRREIILLRNHFE